MAGPSRTPPFSNRSDSFTPYPLRHIRPNNLTYLGWFSEPLRVLPLTGFRYHPEPIRQFGIEVKDLCTTIAARFMLYGVYATLVCPQKAWSFHLDVKASEKKPGLFGNCPIKIKHLFTCFLKTLYCSVKLFTPILALLSFCLHLMLLLSCTTSKHEVHGSCVML